MVSLYFGMRMMSTWEMFLCISPGKVNAPSPRTFWLANWKGREQTMFLKSFHRFWSLKYATPDPLPECVNKILLETRHFHLLLSMIYNQSALQKKKKSRLKWLQFKHSITNPQSYNIYYLVLCRTGLIPLV